MAKYKAGADVLDESVEIARVGGALMKIDAQWTLYRDPRFYASFPSVVAMPDGRCLTAFRRGRESRGLIRPEDRDEFAELCARVDHLDSRSQLVVVRFEPYERNDLALTTVEADPLVSDQDASLLHIGGERLLLGSFSYYHLPRALKPAVDRWRSVRVTDRGEGDCFMGWGAWTAASDDGGRSWSSRRWLPRKPREASWPAMGPHNSAVLRGAGVAVDEEILWATYGGDADVGPGCHCRLYRADADGREWRQGSVIATDAEVQFYEPALYLTPSRRLIAFMRTGELDDHLATAESRDLGVTWEHWQRRAVVGHPFNAAPLSDGRVLLVYGYRHEPYGIRARVLDPECRDLDEAPELVIRDDGPNPDLGYPWAAALGDGSAVVVYYISNAEGVRGIEASLIRGL